MLQIYTGQPTQGKKKLVGEADFDLSYYAKGSTKTEQLQLKGSALEANFYITVMVKVQ